RGGGGGGGVVSRGAAAGTGQRRMEGAWGGAWPRVSSPNAGTATTDNSLTAVGGTQATGLWAVGWRESPGGLQPLVLRYDTAQPSPTWVSVTGAGGVPAPGPIHTGLDRGHGASARHVGALGRFLDRRPH